MKYIFFKFATDEDFIYPTRDGIIKCPSSFWNEGQTSEDR